MGKFEIGSALEMNDPEDSNDYYNGFIFYNNDLENCPDCNGKGYTEFFNHCNTCASTGEVFYVSEKVISQLLNWRTGLQETESSVSSKNPDSNISKMCKDGEITWNRWNPIY